jgi:hypothetical protein
MFYPLVSRIGVVTQPGAYTRKFVSGNRSADAAPADKNPAVSPAVLYSNPYRDRVIRIIDRSRAVGSNVRYVMPQFTKVAQKLLFQFESSMISSDDDAHLSPRLRAR